MNEDKKKMTKEEKVAKAKKLMKDLKALELTQEELKHTSGGVGCGWLGFGDCGCGKGKGEQILASTRTKH